MPKQPSTVQATETEYPPAPPAVETLYRDLESEIRRQRPDEDLGPLEKAFRFAAYHHGNQTRRSGEPYMVHPIEVTRILTEINMDMPGLQTALLHDVVEDTGVKLEEIRKAFGGQVALIVDGVTKLSKLEAYNAEERQAESYRKMLLAMTTDLRVILVKLADRLHNMRTLQNLPPEKQERIARETLEIYAPIAHRLGMGKVRGELEDLAFRFLEPEASADLMREVESRRHEIEAVLTLVQRTVEEKLRQEGIPARVSGRVKRLYSIYQKMKRQKIGLDQIYDLLALRIITDSVLNCYAALGVIHKEWTPIPGRIKDFIAIPRPNLYRSLHTSVIGPGGHAFEVQIRTEEMHRIAEEGIAAHWKYKEGHKGAGVDEQRIAWLRQLVEWQQEMRAPGDFLSTLKLDLYPEEVCCFTPRGKVIVLPKDATPIDFAYAIHSDVGHACVGAKVNGRIVPLRYALRNGDVVEILTQSGHMPSKDWLSIVKTSRARNKIKHVINAAERARAIEIGAKLLEKEARRMGVALGRTGKTELERVAAEYGYSKIEDLHAALGYGRFSPRQILQKLVPPVEGITAPAPETAKTPPAAPPAAAPAESPEGVILKVKGADDVLLYRAKCCNPLPGESIVGYITRGKGVAVHSTNCTNVQSLMYDAERRIEVEWARSPGETFAVRMLVHTDDRPGVLNQLTGILAEEQSNIKNLEAGSDHARGGLAVIDMTVEVKDKKQLERIVSAMRRASGVRDVQRVL